MIYLLGPVLGCITCDFLQELFGNLKQHKQDYASAYLSRKELASDGQFPSLE